MNDVAVPRRLRRTIAVTGATGRVGGSVVRHLVERCDPTAVSVVALARRPEAVDLADADGTRRVAVRRADYDHPASLTAALRGVTDLVFVSSDGEADAVLGHHLAVAEAVRQAGVGRVALLGSIDADAGSPFCYARTNAATERALREVVGDLRVVRAALFDDFLHTLMGDGGNVRMPASGRFAVTTRAATAAALAEAVCDDRWGRARPVVDRITTWGELAAARGQHLVDVDLPAWRHDLVTAGESPWWTYAYVSLLESIGQRRWVPNDPATGGREP